MGDADSGVVGRVRRNPPRRARSRLGLGVDDPRKEALTHFKSNQTTTTASSSSSSAITASTSSTATTTTAAGRRSKRRASSSFAAEVSSSYAKKTRAQAASRARRKSTSCILSEVKENVKPTEKDTKQPTKKGTKQGKSGAGSSRSSRLSGAVMECIGEDEVEARPSTPPRAIPRGAPPPSPITTPRVRPVVDDSHMDWSHFQPESVPTEAGTKANEEFLRLELEHKLGKVAKLEEKTNLLEAALHVSTPVKARPPKRTDTCEPDSGPSDDPRAMLRTLGRKNRDLQSQIAEMQLTVAGERQAVVKAQIDAKDAVNRAKRSAAESKAAHEELKLKVSALAAQLKEATEALEEQARIASRDREELEAAQAAVARAEDAVQASVVEKDHFRAKYEKADKDRVRLQRMVLDLKGNVRVFVRVRPVLASETSVEEPLYRFPGDTLEGAEIDLVQPASKGVDGVLRDGKRVNFEFNRTFSPLSSQEDVFNEVQGLVYSAMDGRRVCVFAYGQTGAGKTFTMEGKLPSSESESKVSHAEESARGIIPRALELVFERAEAMREDGWELGVSVEVLEIYNEKIRDLLASPDASRTHTIRHGSKGHTVVTNLSSHTVTCSDEVYKLLSRAAQARATTATLSNEHSSRSHSVFRVKITATNSTTGQNLNGILNMVDLAGSERVKKSGASSDPIVMREARNINTSLMTLGKVMTALHDKSAHVPFRDSVLTYLLQNCLGKDCCALMLCNLSPLPQHAQESLCSLRFAQLVNKCVTK